MIYSPTDDSTLASPPYPNVVIDQLLTEIGHLINCDQERESVHVVAARCLPPANSRQLARSTAILFACGIIDKQTLRQALRVFRRTRQASISTRVFISEHPVPFALNALYRTGRDFGSDGKSAARFVANLAANVAPEDEFSNHMFYKHVLAARDVILLYWESITSPSAFFAQSLLPFDARLTSFIIESADSAVIGSNTRAKLQWAMDLLQGRLLLGGAKPRGEIFGRSNFSIGRAVAPSDGFQTSTPKNRPLGSACVSELLPTDDGLDIDIDYPTESTARDRSTIRQHVINGFSRKNVRTTSDMSACSRVTYTDYLVEAEENTDLPTYALIWLSALCGIDISRPLVAMRSPKHIPENDEIVIDLGKSMISYNILRRRPRQQEMSWETCGLMCTPVPANVAAGLCELIADGQLDKSTNEAAKLARSFSQTRAGLTTTLIRLRASARVHFAPIGFSELEFSAISGRVAPSVRALSHYYHSSVADMRLRFTRNYKRASEIWKIELPPISQGDSPPVGLRDHLFCPPAEPLQTVKQILEILAKSYENALSQLEPVCSKEGLLRLAAAINLHEMGTYLFQELGMGLRPAGQVADCSVSRTIGAALTADKGSRVFSERSFSPVTSFHGRILDASRDNKEEMKHATRCVGWGFVDSEPDSDLACHYYLRSEDATIMRERLTGHIFRSSLLALPQIYELNDQPNWIRKVIAQHIQNSVPQWQADEFLSHRRVGREPTGYWSTAGLTHFKTLSTYLEDTLGDLVPDTLFKNVRLDPV